MKTVEHNGHILTFNEEKHIYLLDGNIPMTSVTTLVKEQFNPFDEIAVSEKCAGKGKYKGLTPEEVRATWKEKANFGTLLHTFAEKRMKNEEVEDTKPIENFIPILEFFIKELKKTYELVASEMIIFSPKHKISGTIDLLLKNKQTGEYLLADWKSNDQIKISNYFQKGKGGLGHLDDCNFNHYSLQLNIYSYLLESEGYFPWFDYTKQLFHITPTTVNIFPIEPMEKELGYILKL